MKKINFLHVTVLSIVAIFYSSCKTENFTSRKYTHFDNSQAAVKIKKPSAENKNPDVAVSPFAIPGNNTPDNQITENPAYASSNNELISVPVNKNTFPAKAIASSITQSFESKIKPATSTPKNKAYTSETKQEKPAYDILLLILLAILLPPVAVYLIKGLSAAFWLNLLLTFFFWVPGVIHALIVVLSEGEGRGSDQRRSGAN